MAVQIHLNSQRRRQETHYMRYGLLPSIPTASHLLQADATHTIDLAMNARFTSYSDSGAVHENPQGSTSDQR